MAVTLQVRDEPASSVGEARALELEFPTHSITVRELIRERVYQEVDDHNRRERSTVASPQDRALVRPTPVEVALNGPWARRGREADWQRQFEFAIRAYERRELIVLVGERQTESLDERIEIQPQTEVTFLRLVQLAGG